MIELEKVKDDAGYLEDIRSDLYDLIGRCIGAKNSIKDMDNWEIVHDLEFQLELAYETLKRYLDKMEIEDE